MTPQIDVRDAVRQVVLPGDVVGYTCGASHQCDRLVLVVVDPDGNRHLVNQFPSGRLEHLLGPLSPADACAAAGRLLRGRSGSVTRDGLTVAAGLLATLSEADELALLGRLAPEVLPAEEDA